MAIEKKLICCKEQANFDKLLKAGDILDYSIVFIKDTQRIWTHGTYFSSLAELMEDIDNITTEVNTATTNIVDINTNLEKLNDSKQDTLTPGDNITIVDNIISTDLTNYVTTDQLNEAIEGITPEGGGTVSKVTAENADTTGILEFYGIPQIGDVTITASLKETELREYIENFGYVTQSELSNYVTQSDLSNKQDKLYYYSENTSTKSVDIDCDKVYIDSNNGDTTVRTDGNIYLYAADKAYYNDEEIATVTNIPEVPVTKYYELWVSSYDFQYTYNDSKYILTPSTLTLYVYAYDDSTTNHKKYDNTTIEVDIMYTDGTVEQFATTTGGTIDLSNISGKPLYLDITATVNESIIITKQLYCHEQTTLQHYNEEGSEVTISWDNNTFMSITDDGFCDIVGPNGVDVQSNTYFKYNNTNVLTMDNILVGSKDITEIGFDNSNLIDGTFANWNNNGCAMAGTTVQGADCYQATLSSSSNSLSTSVSLSRFDSSITGSWFTFSFYATVTSTNTLYIELSPLDTSIKCLVDGEERTASDVISLILSPYLLSATNIRFHTVSFKIDASQMINPSLTLTLTSAATSGASVTVGAPKLEVGKFATITPEVTTESEKVLDEIRNLWPSSSILNRLGYWFDSASYISSAQIMDYDSITKSVRIRFYLHSNDNVSTYWILSMEGNVAQVISNCGTPNFYGAFDLVVPYSDDSFLTLTHQYSLTEYTS